MPNLKEATCMIREEQNKVIIVIEQLIVRDMTYNMNYIIKIDIMNYKNYAYFDWLDILPGENKRIQKNQLHQKFKRRF